MILSLMATATAYDHSGENAVKSSATGASMANNSPVGQWERSFTDAVGQKYHEVLELKADGTYVKHASGWANDHGRYAIGGNKISFRSSVDQRHTRDVTFEMTDASTLKIDLTPSLGGQQAAFLKQVEAWTRVAVAPNFRTLVIDGRRVPRALPRVMMSALVSEARPWKANVLPTRIQVEENGSGDYRVTFHFYSPSKEEEMRIRVDPYEIKKSIVDGERTFKNALPPDFMDLPQILALAKNAGLKGWLKKADVRIRKGFGAVWSVATNKQGMALSAETGEVITQDMTGYIARYNADWNRIRKLWAQAMRRAAPRPTTSFNWPDSGSGSSHSSGSDYQDPSASTPSYDSGSQNAWAAGDWDAYNRFQSGTPNGDDCYKHGC